MTAAIHTQNATPSPGLKVRAVVDPFLDVLLAMLSANIRHAVAAAWNDVLGMPAGHEETTAASVLARTYAYPVTVDMLNSAQMPALCAWRARSRYKQAGKRRHRRATIALRYWMDEVPFDHMERRWPLLHAVEEVISDTLSGAISIDVDGPDGVECFSSTSLLSSVGLVRVLEESMEFTVDFAQSVDGDVGHAIPVLQMTFDVELEADMGPFRYKAEELKDLCQFVVSLNDARPATSTVGIECGLEDGEDELVSFAFDCEGNAAGAESCPSTTLGK